MQAFGFEDGVSPRFGAARRERLPGGARRALLARAVLDQRSPSSWSFGSIVGILWFGAQPTCSSGLMTGGRLAQFMLYAALAGGARSASLSEVWGECCSRRSAPPNGSAEILAVKPEIAIAAATPEPLARAGARRDPLRRVSFAYPPGPTHPLLSGLELRRSAPASASPSSARRARARARSSACCCASTIRSRRRRASMASTRRGRPGALRGRFALVPQEPTVFADTIAENIRYGRPDASARGAARREWPPSATLHRALPEGYDTPIGERGVHLVRRPASAHRDRPRDPARRRRSCCSTRRPARSTPRASASCRTRSTALMQNRTTIVIAHRLATVLAPTASWSWSTAASSRRAACRTERTGRPLRKAGRVAVHAGGGE